MTHPKSGAITVRDLPPEVAKAVKDKAKKEGLSLNRAVIRLLEEATGHVKDRHGASVLYDDLDDFSGRWTKREADAFDRFLKEHREIDPEMWK